MRILLSILSTLAVLLLAAAAVIWTGAYNVAATDAHLAPVRYALDAAMANSVAGRYPWAAIWWAMGFATPTPDLVHEEGHHRPLSRD